MAKRAVLIGINYINDPANQLGGCVNDAKDMYNVLVNKFGFNESDITLLFDEGNDGEFGEPTAENIKNAIEAAVALSEDGDVLFIHYSGHGSQTVDTTGEEADGKDEFLCPSDDVPITDDVLKYWLSKLSPGVKLTFIADCCHSGSLLDQEPHDVQVSGAKDEEEAEGWEVEGDGSARSISWEVYAVKLQDKFGNPATFTVAVPYVDDTVGDDLDAENPAQWLRAISANAGEADVSHLQYCVLITGCEDHQTSADVPFAGGRRNGALTKALVEVLEASETVPSCIELVSKVRGKLAASGMTQNPNLCCPAEVAALTFVDLEELAIEEGAGEEEYAEEE